MDLDRKYELGEVVVNDGESKTFRAREIATGREVFVHIIYGGRSQGREPLLNAVLQRSMDPSPEKRRQVIEIDDHKGMPFAVTERIPDFAGLRQWIERDRAVEGTAAERDPITHAARWRVPAFGQPSAPAGAPGEFTKAFGEQPGSQDTPHPAPDVPAGQPAPSFTGLFRATVGETRKMPAIPAQPLPPAEVPAAPTPPAEPAPQSAPGEFTVLFAKPPAAETGAPHMPEPPAAAAPPAPAPPPAPQSAPGEFTMLFAKPPVAGPGAPHKPEAAPLAAPPAPAPPAQSPAPQPAAGEFTMLFGKAAVPAEPPSRPAAPAEPAVQAPPPAPPSAPPAPQPSTQPAAPAGPGEFTMLFGKSPFASPQPEPQGERMPTAPPPAGPAQTPPPASAPSSFTALFQASPAPHSAEPASQPPGDFDLFSSPAPQSGGEEFGPPVPGQSRPPVPPPSPSPSPFGPPPAAPSKPSSEFTKYFADAPVAGKPAAQSPFSAAPPQRPSGATGAFSAPLDSPFAPAAPASVPGEYTRMFGGPPAGAPGMGGMPPSGGAGMPGFGPPPAPMQPAAGMPMQPAPGMQQAPMMPGMQMQPMQMQPMQPQAQQMQGMPGMQMQAPQAPGMQMAAGAPPAAQGSKGLLLVVIVLAALFILALATIGYLLIRK